MAVSGHPPAPTPSSSSRVSPDTIERAVRALLKWRDSKAKTQKATLLEPDDFIYLILTLKKIPSKARTNPFKVPIPHSMIDPATSEICLIIDDRSRSNLTKDAAQKKIKSENIPVSKVLKLSKLRTNYKPFEAKRKLCDSYDMFLADKRVIPVLPRLLGKHFYKKKKIPVGVDLKHKNWKEQIERVCGSALLFLGTGTCSVLKVGKVSMGKEEIVKNVAAAIEGVVEIVPRKWKNVRSFHLKLLDSLALPIYQVLPDVKLKIEGVKEVGGVDKKVEEKEEEEEEEEEEKNVIQSEGKASESMRKNKKGAKKGRIHEVRYMDNNLDEIMDEDEDDNVVETGEAAESDDDDEHLNKLAKSKKKEGNKEMKSSLSRNLRAREGAKTKKSKPSIEEGKKEKKKKTAVGKVKV